MALGFGVGDAVGTTDGDVDGRGDGVADGLGDAVAAGAGGGTAFAVPPDPLQPTLPRPSATSALKTSTAYFTGGRTATIVSKLGTDHRKLRTMTRFPCSVYGVVERANMGGNPTSARTRGAIWAIMDSNHGPHAYQACALTN